MKRRETRDMGWDDDGTMKAADFEYDPEIPVIEAIQAGDSHAMAELIRRQGRCVRGVIFGVLGRLADVDDVAQRVWMRVWQRARQLDDPRRWRAWLYRTARNAATDAGRHRQRRHRLLAEVEQVGQRAEYPLNGATHAGSPEQKALTDERQQTMLEAIAGLPPLYREPFVLRHLQDWSCQQIGQVLGLPIGTVETRLVRARRLLRQQLRGKL